MLHKFIVVDTPYPRVLPPVQNYRVDEVRSRYPYSTVHDTREEANQARDELEKARSPYKEFQETDIDRLNGMLKILSENLENLGLRHQEVVWDDLDRWQAMYSASSKEVGGRPETTPGGSDYDSVAIKFRLMKDDKISITFYELNSANHLGGRIVETVLRSDGFSEFLDSRINLHHDWSNGFWEHMARKWSDYEWYDSGTRIG